MAQKLVGRLRSTSSLTDAERCQEHEAHKRDIVSSRRPQASFIQRGVRRMGERCQVQDCQKATRPTLRREAVHFHINFFSQVRDDDAEWHRI